METILGLMPPPPLAVPGLLLATWRADDIIPETARRELARCLMQAPLLDISTDHSGTDQEPAHRRKKGMPLKSGKVRTADSTVIKRINWTHELVYTSGGEPVTYELILCLNL